MEYTVQSKCIKRILFRLRCQRHFLTSFSSKSINFLTIVFIDEVEGFKRRIIYEAVGRVYNPALEPRHRGDKRYLTTSLVEIKDQTF